MPHALLLSIYCIMTPLCAFFSHPSAELNGCFRQIIPLYYSPFLSFTPKLNIHKSHEHYIHYCFLHSCSFWFQGQRFIRCYKTFEGEICDTIKEEEVHRVSAVSIVVNMNVLPHPYIDYFNLFTFLLLFAIHSTLDSVDLHSTDVVFNGLHILPDRRTRSFKKSAKQYIFMPSLFSNSV